MYGSGLYGECGRYWQVDVYNGLLLKVKLTFDMLTMRRQQHSFSTHGTTNLFIDNKLEKSSGWQPWSSQKTLNICELLRPHR